MLPVFPVYYFPPVSWFSAWLQYPGAILDQHSHFRKQGYSNRMRIQAANKILPLSIPVRRTGEQTPVSKSEISYTENWQKDHWKGIESAYRSAPFFEYYEPKIYPFFESKAPLLLQHNLSVLRELFALLDIETGFELSESYQAADAYEKDFRLDFDGSGQRIPQWFNAVPYPQVFRNLEPDLSILDLLCNEGPAAREIVREGWKGK